MQLRFNRMIFNGAMYVGILAVILAFMPFLHVEFELPKVAILKICIWVMLLTTLWKFIHEGFLSIPKRVEKWVGMVGIGFIAVIILGVAISGMPVLSLFGTYQRFDGAIGYTYIGVFFLLMILGIQEKEVFEKAIKFMGWALLVVFIYALLQKLGLDPFGYNLRELSLGRVFSTMGHPNFLASLIVLVAPSVGVYWLKRSGKLVAWAWMLMFLILLGLTESREGILGLIAGGICYYLITGIWAKTLKKRISYIVVAAVVATTILGLYIKTDDSWLSSGRSANYRLLMWNETVKMIIEKPFFGHGLATFGIEFQRNTPKEMIQYEEANVVADRPHNMILELLFEGGFAAFAIWISGIILVFSVALKTKKIEAAAIASSISGFIVANQFGFSVVTHLAVLAFLLAYLVSLANKGFKTVYFPILEDKVVKSLLLIFFTVLTFFVIIFQGVFPVLADYFAERGLIALEQKNANETVRNLLIAHEFNPKIDFYNYLLAEVFIQVEDDVQAEKYLQLAGSFSNYKDAYYYYVKAKIAEAQCLKGKNAECDVAEKNYWIALERAPSYPLFKLNLGIFQAKNNKCSNAKDTLDQYISLVGRRFQASDSEVERLFYKNNPEFSLAVKYLAKCKS